MKTTYLAIILSLGVLLLTASCDPVESNNANNTNNRRWRSSFNWPRPESPPGIAGLEADIYSSIFPPAASIAAFAPLVSIKPFTVTAFSNLPDSMTFTRSVLFLISRAVLSASTSITSTS